MIDPLSDLLSLLKVRNVRCTRLEASGRWGLSFPARPILKFVAVLRGSCWLVGAADIPQQLSPGDTFLLFNAPTYGVASDPDMALQDGSQLFGQLDENMAQLGGDDVILLGGSFVVEADDLSALLSVLPPFFLVPAHSPPAAMLRNTLDMLDAELERTGIGSSLMIKHLADILLLQALRAYAARSEPDDLGWIGALVDRHIGSALALMHADPGRRWSVAELASAVGLSRSSFAARFTKLVGSPPLDYLLRWRMQRARLALRQNDLPIGRLAADLGYASESAFGNAFKRVVGCSPKRYWSNGHLPAVTGDEAGRGRSAGPSPGSTDMAAR